MTALDDPLAASEVSLYVPRPALVRRVTPLTALETLFELAMLDGHPLGHQPGQFVQFSILGIGECPISVSSSPTRPNTFELCIRRAGEVTAHIHRLAPGQIVGIRGPLGHGFEVAELRGKDLLVVAGGCGMAPTRSLVQYVLDRRDDFGEFTLLYGSRSPKEILFVDELRQWRARCDANVHLIVEHRDESWTGDVGVVTRLFRKLPPLRPGRTAVVIVGPPVMFRFVVMEVLSRRIPQDDIYLSLERRMKCGVGKCGHCQANNLYVCMDGPVFCYRQLHALREALE
ncbi:MAG: FAD/NAD(P)-binding protein [Phycisphaerae bacterium]